MSKVAKLLFPLFVSAIFAGAVIVAHASQFTYTYTDGNGISATGTLTGDLIAPNEYNLTSGTITLQGAPPCTNCGGLSGPLNGTGILASPPPQPFQVGGGTELIGLDNLLFSNTDPQLDTNGGLSFQMSSGLGIGMGGNGPGNYWIFGGNWSLNDNNGIFVATPVPQSSTSTYDTGFENFALGDVDSQFGWTSGFIGQGGATTALFDVKIVSNIYGYPSFQTKSLRISNATTSSAFGDQTFSASLANEAGETDAATSTYSGGVRQPYFEAQWDFASAVPNAEQPGLSVVASADPGNGSRMTWLQMQDTPSGLQLNFEDYESSVSDFVETTIATGIDRTIPHTIKMTIQFVDGPSNDIVKIYLDGVLIHTGTTWEDYSRSVGSEPSPVDSIMFRVAGTPAPATAGKGFLIDNFSEFSGPIPVVSNAATKFIFANVTSSAVVGNSTAFTIEAVNALGAIDASFEQGVTLTVGGSGTGGGLVTIVNGVGTSTVSDSIAQTVALGLEDSQSTGLDVSASATVNFVPGLVTQFVLNHPGNMNTGTRLGYAIARKDQFGNVTSAGDTVAYLYSDSSSTNAAFFTAPSGGTAIASTTILDGSTSTAFWYYDDLPGPRTVTVSDNASAPDGAAGIVDASDTFAVAPGAVKFIFADSSSSVMAGNGATVNVYAVDSFNNIDPTFGGGITVIASGSATGGGLVNMVNGVGTTTITDQTAETVALGFLDTQNTGLGVGATAQIVFSSVPVAPTSSANAVSGAGVSSAIQAALGIKPGVTITFSGRAYPGASVSVIRKDLGLQTAPVMQTVSAAADGSFLIELNNVTRLTGQTYLLSFMDKNGLIAQTKAYNIPVQDKLVYGNILAAPTLGFESSSVVANGKPLPIMGYATPNATVEFFVDGNPAGTVVVNDPSGKYGYTLTTDGLSLGRHAIWAIQKYAESAVEIAGYTNALSKDELFVDDATNGTLLNEDASGTYSFVPASGVTGTFYPITVGQPYTKQAESDFSNQTSFTISPLQDPKLDLSGDGVVDIRDLSVFLSYIKSLNASLTSFHSVDPNIVKTLDFNGDGVVDVNDLNILTAVIAHP